MIRRKLIDAFQAYYQVWKGNNPQCREYIPFDLQDFFMAGAEAYKEIIWYPASELAERGESIFVYEPHTGECYISYGGGPIDHGFWTYAKNIFSEEIMETIRERDSDLAAWFEEEERRKRMSK